METVRMEKSYLINMICDHLQEIARNHKINPQSPVFILALTGVAAFNIHDVTIYSVLSIPISRNNLDKNV